MYAYVGLGANLGDRARTLAQAVVEMARLGAVLRRSSLYETEPVGPPQPRYLNAAILVDTPLSPEDLLAGLLRIEAALGRRRPCLRDAPRTLDLDLLLLGEDGSLVFRSSDLVVPHPRLHQRAFALRPLLDLEPALVHPVLGSPLERLYRLRLAIEQAPRPAGPWPAALEPS
ncbi:MAG: 2-amino-4-hydroxy-6-hydroxymethyldihydropteridine diphosphokinase [Myxococcales bacterium]|nr:2-amino-4-hydroxy-6-hydroxymethyldihydropteridine diphosphokinase [Myxococcota bacterium]MDW8281361.1 2-amino-4-hydroxy-6-hydroxymethyldihydropteridine diphosphokinase [Myxococcales bacterium]